MPVDPTEHRIMHEFVRSITYQPRTRTGYLKLAQHYPPDMSGSIRLFTRIDPQAQTILCYDGRHLNTRYAREADGKWVCTLFEPMR